MNLPEHLLTCLSEECVEVSKDIHKALRFGLDDRNVLDPTGPTNRERIIEELNDLMTVIVMLEDEQILPRDWSSISAQSVKRNKIRKFIQYAKDVGALRAPVAGKDEGQQ